MTGICCVSTDAKKNVATGQNGTSKNYEQK